MHNLKIPGRYVILKDMQIIAREVRNYTTPEGRNPFRDRLTQLRDKRTRANIQRRIARLQEGNYRRYINYRLQRNDTLCNTVKTLKLLETISLA